MLVLLTLIGLFSSLFYSFEAEASSYLKPPYFYMGGEVLWVKQSSDNTDFGIRNFDVGFFTLPKGKVVRINPPFQFSGAGYFGYRFFNNADLRFDFILHHHDAKGQIIASLDPLIGTAPTRLPARLGITGSGSAKSHYDYEMNVAALNIGYWLNMSLLKIRAYSGITLLDAKIVQTAGYSQGLNPNNVFARSSDAVSILSAGPSFGMDFHYDVFGPISLMSDVNFNVLIGKIDANYNSSRADNFDTTQVENKLKLSLMELFKLKVGFEYKKRFSERTVLQLSTGYQLLHVLNSTASRSSPSFFVTPAVVNLFDNQGFHGPFVALSASFM